MRGLLLQMLHVLALKSEGFKFGKVRDYPLFQKLLNFYLSRRLKIKRNTLCVLQKLGEIRKGKLVLSAISANRFV